MKSYEYECVMFEGNIYCNECCPVLLSHEGVHPIFADTETDEECVCCECGCEHDYMLNNDSDGEDTEALIMESIADDFQDRKAEEEGY